MGVIKNILIISTGRNLTVKKKQIVIKNILIMENQDIRDKIVYYQIIILKKVS